MPIFMMFGKYSAESLKEVSADRTKKAVKIIEKNGGENHFHVRRLGGARPGLYPGFSRCRQGSFSIDGIEHVDRYFVYNIPGGGC